MKFAGVVVVVSLIAAPTPARAGGDAFPFLGGMIFGGILGAIITDHNHHRPQHYYEAPPPVYYYPPPNIYYLPPTVMHRPERRCVTEAYWDHYGRRHWHDRCWFVYKHHNHYER